MLAAAEPLDPYGGPHKLDQGLSAGTSQPATQGRPNTIQGIAADSNRGHPLLDSPFMWSTDTQTQGITNNRCSSQEWQAADIRPPQRLHQAHLDNGLRLIGRRRLTKGGADHEQTQNWANSSARCIASAGKCPSSRICLCAAATSVAKSTTTRSLSARVQQT
jgi:hypothetical protein